MLAPVTRIPVARGLFLASLLGLAAPVQAVAQDAIAVMTQNQYLGADLAPLFAAADAGAFNDALVAALEQVAANDFAERSGALAASIAKRAPHVVGLQEVWFFGCFDPPDVDVPAGEGCENPRIAGAFDDHLLRTLSALGQAGLSYVLAARVRNLNLSGLPFWIDGHPGVLVAMDRDVILVRGDVSAVRVDPEVDFGCAEDFVSVDGCNYSTVLEVEVPLGFATVPVSVERGFVGVDVILDDATYRVVNTHLEVFEPVPGYTPSRAIQAAQAYELLTTLAGTTQRLIVVGDMNSSPEHEPVDGIVPPYQQFVGAGFNDAWGPRQDSGYTCCQAADLLNTASTLSERIDMIFARDVPFLVKTPEVLGDSVGDKTPPPGQGLWPSDHGAVAAEIHY